MRFERCETERNLFELGRNKSYSEAQKQTRDKDTNTASTGLWSEIIRLTSKLICQIFSNQCVYVCVCVAA